MRFPVEGHKCIRVAGKIKQYIMIYHKIQQQVLFELFLLDKVSFESDTGMKDLYNTREQSLGICDVVNIRVCNVL